MRRPFSAWFRSFARGKIRRGSHRAKNKRSSDFLRRRVARVESLEPRRMLAADLDFDQVAILADPFQDGQSGSPTLAEPLDGGKTLHLEGNAWKYVQVDYPVTAETILSFDFSSDAEGELHGVELANDLTYSTNTHFQLYGTQTWGIQDYRTYSAGGEVTSAGGEVTRYEIPIGQYTTGTTTYLAFVNDDDASAAGHSYFSNIWLFEPRPALATVSATGDFDGDAIAETVIWNAADTRWELQAPPGDTPDVFDPWTDAVDWTQVVVGDWNGDGLDDLAGRDRMSGGWEAGVSNGVRFFRQSWGDADHLTLWQQVYAGDFDGDGRDDLLGWNGQLGQWQFLAYDKPNTDQIVEWGSAGASIDGRGDLVVGDANQDGREDLVRDVGQDWQVALSQGASLGAAQNWSAWFDEWVGPTGAVDFAGPTNAVLAIYQDIYNTVEAQFYPGLMKGPEATWQTKAGNSWDQAALLVRELEAAGFEADLASGRVQASANQVADWVGAKTAEAAEIILRNSLDKTAELLQSPTLGEVIEFDHAWVRVLLPTANGLPTTAAFEQWMDLDPSWKFRDYQPGVATVASAAPFDQVDYLSALRDVLPSEYHEEAVVDYLAANLPGAALSEVPYDGPILTRTFLEIPADLEVTPLATPARHDNLESADALDKHRVRITLARGSDGYSLVGPYEISVPEQGLQRITVGYFGASLLFPRLLLDGAIVESATFAVNSTDTLNVTLDHLDPGDDVVDRSYTYSERAGDTLAIGLDAEQFSYAYLADLAAEVSDATLALSTPAPLEPGEAVVGATLSLALAKYWHDYNQQAAQVSALMGVATARSRVGSGVASSDEWVDYFWDLQYPAVPRNFSVDLQNGVYFGVDAVTGSISADAARLTTLNASALEHAIVEEFTNAVSVSTVKGLQLAAEAGDPVYVFEKISGQGIQATHLDGAVEFTGGSSNDVRNLLELSTSVENAIVSAINGWSTVTAPKNETILPQWSGAVYITEKVTSSSLEFGYLIDGGFGPLNGGYQADVPEPAPIVPLAQTAPNQTYAGDPVNVANGNVFHDEIDLVIPNVGFPLQFGRHFDSQNDEDLANLGVGWVHSFSDLLLFEDTDEDSDTDIVWVTSQGQRHTFLNNGTGYDVPITLHGALSQDGSYWEFRHKEGTTYRFSPSGQLTKITDRYGNFLNLLYNGNGTLGSVEDGVDSTRKLSFAYGVNNKIASVSDFTGRVWTFDYETIGGQEYLSQVAPPSDAATASTPTSYSYYDASGGDPARLEGLIKTVTEPNGAWHTFEYTANRRARRVIEGVAGAPGDPDAVTSSHALFFNLSRSETTFVDERGLPTIYAHDSDGLLLRQTNPDHSREEYLWQDFQMVSHTNPRGFTETFEFSDNGLGNLERTTSFDGIVTEYSYLSNFSMTALH